MANVTGHLKVYQRKRGPQYYLRWRDAEGRPHKKRLGPAWTKNGRPPKGHYTKSEAEAALRKKLVEVEEQEPARGERVTFKTATEEFLRYLRKVRQVDQNTIRDYESVINGEDYLLDYFGRETPVEEIDADWIEKYRDGLMGKVSNRTVVRHLTVLNGILKRAQRKEWVPNNQAAASMVERPKVVYTGEFDTFDGDEVERLAAAADNETYAALYRVAAYTGLRVGELFALRWEHVDFVGGLLHVRRTWDHKHRVEKMPKGKKVRSVPMIPAVVNSLAALKEREHFTGDGDLVFCNDVGEHLEYWTHRRRYMKALEEAGLRSIPFHSLRHAFGTAAITELDPFKVQSYMGHQHYSTTQRYLHHKPQHEDAAAIGKAFAGRGGDRIGVTQKAGREPGREPADSTRN